MKSPTVTSTCSLRQLWPYSSHLVSSVLPPPFGWSVRLGAAGALLVACAIAALWPLGGPWALIIVPVLPLSIRVGWTLDTRLRPFLLYHRSDESGRAILTLIEKGPGKWQASNWSALPRGRGIGGRLARRMLDEQTALGREIWFKPANARLRVFYRSWGAVDAGRRWLVITPRVWDAVRERPEAAER